MSKSVIAPYALLPDGWTPNVRIEIDERGMIATIASASRTEGASLLGGPIVPGMANAHSHAFQRAFAGRAERANGTHETFWTWRRAMYGLAERLTPDDLESIAAQLYVDMLEAGYTSVGEFHYLHHDLSGMPFARRSENSARLIAAANASGIGLTLLPVFYRWSGFGAQPALPEQARFTNTLDAYLALLDEIAPLARTNDVRLGVAPHSLRAVAPDDLHALLEALRERGDDMPIHLHIAEQRAEVEAAVEQLGARPIDWLLAHADIDKTWTLVHATHASESELAALARAQATICLTPTTEANLGDGIFALGAWHELGGRTAIGSDSHVSLDLTEELRWLEYAQRLAHEQRTIAPSLEALYLATARAGASALGQQAGVLAPGYRADFLVLDPDASVLAGDDLATLVDRFIIAGSPRAIRAVYARGVHVVERGVHQRRESIAATYRATLAKLFPATT